MTPKSAWKRIMPMIDQTSGEDAEALGLAAVALEMWHTLRESVQEMAKGRPSPPLLMPGDTVWQMRRGLLIKRKIVRVVYRSNRWTADAEKVHKSQDGAQVVVFFSLAKAGEEGIYRDSLQAVAAAIDYLCKEGRICEKETAADRNGNTSDDVSS